MKILQYIVQRTFRIITRFLYSDMCALDMRNFYLRTRQNREKTLKVACFLRKKISFTRK